MSERVVEKKDGIADVRMVRVDKMNAVDMDMFVALVEAGAELARDRSLRAVVLSGEGRAFCSGLNIAASWPTRGSARVRTSWSGPTRARPRLRQWVALQRPTPALPAQALQGALAPSLPPSCQKRRVQTLAAENAPDPSRIA